MTFGSRINGRMGEHVVPGRGAGSSRFSSRGKVVFLTLAFGLPLLLHPFWVVAAVYVLTASVLGLVLGTVFQLAHCVELADFPLERSPGQIENAWAVHQVETTVDFARGSAAAAWLLGGLNFQIEHHLFSRMCHVNYPAIAPVVEQTCAEFGVRYNRNPTVLAARAIPLSLAAPDGLRRLDAPSSRGSVDTSRWPPRSTRTKQLRAGCGRGS